MANARTVTIYVRRESDSEPRLVMADFPREKLEKHSGNFRVFLSQWQVEHEEHRQVTLPTGSPGGLKHVLQTILHHKGDEELYISIAKMGVARTIAIWEAGSVLFLEPQSAMSKLMGHICWCVSHDKITPDVMSKVHAVFAPSIDPEDINRRRPWDCLIHQYVWLVIHDNYTRQQLDALEAVYKQHEELAEVIAKVTRTLQAKKDVHDAQQAANALRRAGRKTSGKQRHSKHERSMRGQAGEKA